MTAALSAGHRHEFKDLKTMLIDEKITFYLLRATKPGRAKAALEVALSGGLLTRTRTAHSKGPDEKKCPWGCSSEDSDLHRYWTCPRWQASRGDLAEQVKDLPMISRAAGWFCVDSGCPLSLVLRVQRHMMFVVQSSSRDFCNITRGKFDPGSDQIEAPLDLGTGEMDEGASAAGVSDATPAVAAASSWATPGIDDIQGGTGLADRTPGSISVPNEQGVGGWNLRTAPRLREIPNSPALPSHVRHGRRTLQGIEGYHRDILHCTRCGMLGSAFRTAQFLKKHLGCPPGPFLAPVSHELTVYEKRLLADAGLPLPPPKKRRGLSQDNAMHAGPALDIFQ